MKCLVFLLFILCFGLEFSRALPATSHDTAPNKLKEGGEHVCFDTVSTYKEVKVSYLSQTIATAYYIHCLWPGFCPKESKKTLVTVTKWRKQWKTVEKKIFRCCTGWSKKADDAQVCLQPICALGCRNGGTCIAPDSCKCKEGYEGQICQNDIDECKVAKGGCSHICKNTIGSYVCMCPVGFHLGADRKTCIRTFGGDSPTMTNKVICQSDPSGELNCNGGDKKVMIIDAIYGRLTKDFCQHGNYTQDLRCTSKDSPIEYLKAACDHQTSCTITITKKVFGDPCPAIEKYLQVTYDCM